MKTLREALEQLMQQHRNDGHVITYADLCAVLALPDAIYSCKALKLPDLAPANCFPDDSRN